MQGRIVMFNRMVHVTETIPAQGTIITNVVCDGESIPAQFRYVELTRKGTTYVGVFGNNNTPSIITESELAPGYWLIKATLILDD